MTTTIRLVIFTLAITIVSTLTMSAAVSYDFEAPAGTNGNATLQYKILSSIDQTVAVMGGTTGIIPCTVTYNNKTYTITEIGRYAFNSVSITDFRLPLSLKAIRECAFGFCETQTIAIPDSVETIDQSAFHCSNVETIIVGSGVKTIGNGAFYKCSNLKTLVFKSSQVPSYGGYSIGNSYTSIIVPQLKDYNDSDIARAALGTMVEPIYFPEHTYVYSGSTPQLEFEMKIGSATTPHDMLLKNKDVGNYNQSFFIGLSSILPFYGFSDYDGYAIFPDRGIDVEYNYIISKKDLILTIDNQQRIYGENNPSFFSYSISGFVDDETETELNEPIIPNTCATILSDVGDYPISCNVSARNYEIIVNNGVLSILKAPIVAQVKDAERAYGFENPIFSCEYIGLKNNDNPILLTPFKFETASIFSNVGEYYIKCSEGSFKNYYVNEYRSGTLIITKAPLVLNATSTTREYCEPNPQFSFTLVGLRNNDTADCLFKQPSFECEATLSSNCGEYAIIPSGASALNYSVTYENGTLSITPASMIIKASNITREYGEENPILKYELIGLKGDDNIDNALQEQPSLTTNALSTSNVGEYSIIVNGGIAKNYTLSYRSGTLTIIKAPLSVIAKNAERIYGDANPTFVRSYLGFKLNDTENTAFSVLPKISCSATKDSSVGEYPITVSEGTSRNYEIMAYESGILTISKATVVLTPINKSRLYFEENPQFDFTLSGLRNGDSKSCLSVLPQYVCDANKLSNVGTYPIFVSNAQATNYNFEYGQGLLTVNPQQLIASIGNYSRPYGTDNPVFEISYNGFVNNEDESVLTQPSLASCSATKSSDVGTYSISISGGEAINYIISKYNSGSLIIEKANQTITWDQDLSNIELYAQVELTAKSDVGLPITYEMSPNNVATLYSSGDKWYLDCYGSGSINIRATQNGDKNHNAANLVSKTIIVYGSGDDPHNPQIYLNIEEAGTLSSMIADNRKYQIKNLRLTGYLNGTDINFLREMSGSDSNGNTTNGVLETLDISGCTIVAGGRSYYKSSRTTDYVVGDYMFYNCKVLATLHLPDNSTQIGDYSLADCERLSIITIPNSVKKFGAEAFRNDISLLHIPMPELLTSIDDMAFMGCNGLTEITIPSEVSVIGKGIVKDCENITRINVEIGNSNFTSVDGVLFNNSIDKLIIFPVNHSSNDYEVTEGVKTIAPYAFVNAKGLKIVSLPSTLNTIDQNAFIGCINLQTLKVHAITPPICQNDCFESVSKTRCELQVPIGCHSSYWVAPIWSEFNEITEVDFSGINNIAYDDLKVKVENGKIIIHGGSSNHSVRIYNINGSLMYSQEISNSEITYEPSNQGVYIVVVGNQIYKLFLK